MKQKLINLGGKEWQKHDKHRIYFNRRELEDLIGLEYEKYNSGNIRTATLNGELISNSKARKLLSGIQYGKFWYDLDLKEFASYDMAETTRDLIKEAIESKIEEMEEDQDMGNYQLVVTEEGKRDVLFTGTETEVFEYIKAEADQLSYWIADDGNPEGVELYETFMVAIAEAQSLSDMYDPLASLDHSWWTIKIEPAND